MNSIVECVPNFSEGRDRSIVERIIDAILAVPGLCLMDVEMDGDHNRSVVTFVGQKEKVGEGALHAIGQAAALIDLTRHHGSHPRIGATDVVPFIPVRNVTLEECVAIARFVGEEAARRYGIPIYLYEAAATRPERVHLENIRKGQFEGLREEIAQSPERHPDFGAAQIHPTAGATVVGARKFLIAYNINLNTPDVSIAKEIAKRVRQSGGGLPCVKAMGVDLKSRGLAQVSMNLTDYEQTPISRAFEMVKQEAELFGADISGSEVVGLMPQAALDSAAQHYLQIENFRPEMIFENRLQMLLSQKQTLPDISVAAFLGAVSAANSVPGGGSVAALAGALAASLGEMVAGISISRKELGEFQTQLQELLEKFGAMHLSLQAAMQKDSDSYAGFESALKMPKASDEEKKRRQERMQQALQAATLVPLDVAEKAAGLLQSFQELEPVSNPNLKSDLQTGFWMAIAAIRGALANVAINLKSIKDELFSDELKRRVQAVEDAVALVKPQQKWDGSGE
jgi:glutamate formiminotransferase / formiminotetrahydrofolate cyclodeaminase